MKKFEKIIIATDLDGTFLDECEKLVAKNVEAIEYFKANGGHVTVATGRAPLHAAGAVRDIEKLINMPAVTCNGACVYDFSRGAAVTTHEVAYADVISVIDLIRREFPTAGIRASSPEYCFVSTPDDLKNPLIEGDLKRYEGYSNLIAPTDEWSSLKIYKVVVRIDADTIKRAGERIKEVFGDTFSPSQSWPTIIDLQPSGVNKGKSLMEYVHRFMGEDHTVYACGDYLNDLELLGAADVAVCPSNAHPDIKAISNLCLCSNNDGIIADLIERI